MIPMRIFFLELFLISFSAGCVTRQDVMVDVYQNDGIPKVLCDQNPDLWQYGIFRVVMCKDKPQSPQCQHGEDKFEEMRPYCAESIKDYLSMSREDVEKWLKKLTTPK